MCTCEVADWTAMANSLYTLQSVRIVDTEATEVAITASPSCAPSAVPVAIPALHISRASERWTEDLERLKLPGRFTSTQVELTYILMLPFVAPWIRLLASRWLGRWRELL